MSPTDLGVHVERTTDLTRYRFEAELPLLWTERLAGGLAALGEDIAELAADRHAGVWKVEWSVRGRPNVDLAHLMRDAESRSDGLASHVLDSFQVTRADDGALELVVRALDRPRLPGVLAARAAHARPVSRQREGALHREPGRRPTAARQCGRRRTQRRDGPRPGWRADRPLSRSGTAGPHTLRLGSAVVAASRRSLNGGRRAGRRGRMSMWKWSRCPSL
jgi:hypothetical protein